MLYTQFFVDNDRYVISIKDIVEIVPCVTLKAVPQLPDYSAGLMNYHGKPVPVIDICTLMVNRHCRKKLSTRIIIVEDKKQNDKKIMLGILAERATETVELEDGLFQMPTMRNPDIPAIGPVIVDKSDLVTKISITGIFEKLDDKFFFPENSFPLQTG